MSCDLELWGAASHPLHSQAALTSPAALKSFLTWPTNEQTSPMDCWLLSIFGHFLCNCACWKWTLEQFCCLQLPPNLLHRWPNTPSASLSLFPLANNFCKRFASHLCFSPPCIVLTIGWIIRFSICSRHGNNLMTYRTTASLVGKRQHLSPLHKNT